MYHVFKKSKNKYLELVLPGQNLFGNKMKSILTSDVLNNPASNGAISICPHCYFKGWKTEDQNLDLHDDFDQYRMVIQNVNFPNSLNEGEKFEPEFHSVESMLFIPEKTKEGTIAYFPFFIFCHPLHHEFPPIRNNSDLRDYSGIYKKDCKESKEYNYPNVQTRHDRHREFEFTMTSGYLNTNFCRSGSSNDLFIWPAQWQKLQAFIGHDKMFGDQFKITEVSQYCSVCRLIK